VSGLSSWLLLLIFIGAAGIIWVAGIALSDTTDVLSARLHLGTALGGLILLAVATNLPELAITASAALSGDVSVAVGNILGGIAIQTVVLVVLDAGVRPHKPLTYLAASLVLVLEGALVIAVLLVVVMGTQLPEDLVVARLEPAGVLIAVLWVVGLLLVQRAGRGLPWQDETGDAPGGQEMPRGDSKRMKNEQSQKKGHSTTREALVFAGAAAATLVAGVLLERSGEEFFGRIGLSGVVFGATVLAAATSLPEVSSGLTSTRMGDYQLAFGDIFGGNAFLPVLFLLATLLSGKAVLPRATAPDLYLTALGALLTVVYLYGLIFRPPRQILRMGVDSLTVLVLYAVGIAGLVLVAG
jgi:cation:H+ antiporter